MPLTDLPEADENGRTTLRLTLQVDLNDWVRQTITVAELTEMFADAARRTVEHQFGGA